MEEVCELIEQNWKDGFDVKYIEHSFNDELNAVNADESAINYIITQLNIYFGEEIYEIVSNLNSPNVTFKYKDVKISIREWYHSRGYGYWVIDMV